MFPTRRWRICICIVGVVQNPHTVRLPKLQPHFRWRAVHQATLYFSGNQSKFRTDGNRQQGIRHLMPAKQIDPVFTVKFVLRRVYLKRHAVFIQANFLRRASCSFP